MRRTVIPGMRDLSDDRDVARFLADGRINTLRRVQVFKEGAGAQRISPGEQLDSIQRQDLIAKPA